MKIVTYNLHFGGKDRVHWGELIERFDPELMFMQESYAPAQHLPPLLFGSRHEQTTWRRVERQTGQVDWGSAVYCRSHPPVPLEIPGYGGWVVGAEIGDFQFLDTPASWLRAFSLHAPTGQGAYAAVVNAILDQLLGYRDDCDLVVAGDFNLTVSPRHESEALTTSSADLKIQDRMRDEFGLVNCWQHCNPGLPLAQTLRWNNSPATPYHCDGIFVPARWAQRLRGCTVVAGGRWTELSDHNPVVAEFG